MNNLEPLLKELGCKTPAEEISSDRQEMILDFLKKEIEYRKQYKIKRLLSQSGIQHVKTLDQFDWRLAAAQHRISANVDRHAGLDGAITQGDVLLLLHGAARAQPHREPARRADDV